MGIADGLVKREPAFIIDLLDLPARHRRPSLEPLKVTYSPTLKHVSARHQRVERGLLCKTEHGTKPSQP